MPQRQRPAAHGVQRGRLRAKAAAHGLQLRQKLNRTNSKTKHNHCGQQRSAQQLPTTISKMRRRRRQQLPHTQQRRHNQRICGHLRMPSQQLHTNCKGTSTQPACRRNARRASACNCQHQQRQPRCATYDHWKYGAGRERQRTLIRNASQQRTGRAQAQPAHECIRKQASQRKMKQQVPAVSQSQRQHMKQN